MNKQSNTYTITYIIALVVIVGVALAATSLALKHQQTANADADKMKQILASAHITPDKANVIEDFNKYIVEQIVINSDGESVEGNAFAIDVAAESKKPIEQRRLPVYKCQLDQNDNKYILPVYGAGLWGPIWGYIAVDNDGSTIYGAYFAHTGETPGLGAEIDKPQFCNQFNGKHLFKDGRFLPISVQKAGQKPLNGEDYVEAISGGTITSKGVSAMIDNCLSGYSKYLESLNYNK